MVDVTSQKEPDEPPKTGAACHGGMLKMEKRSENYVQKIMSNPMLYSG